MNYFLDVVQNKYVDFKGRARRSEFWYFTLFSTLISFVFSGLDFAFSTGSFANELGIFGAIYSLLVFLPGLAVAVRRLHDTGRSGWWFLIVFTGIGAFVLLYFYVTDGEPGTNKWGRNPKEDGDDILDHLVDDVA